MRSKIDKGIYSVALFVSFISFACGGRTLENSGFIEVKKLDPSIRIDIRYATDSNFTHQKLYPVAKCYLRLEAAESLRAVQRDLKKIGLGLKVLDGYRPLSVQEKMWKILPDTNYVANPAVGSRHNRGTAVDVTLVDSLGHELQMPTGFDNFTDMAHRDYMNLPENVIKNRELLDQLMERHGFVGLSTEWWHFDLKDWKKYPVENLPLK